MGLYNKLAYIEAKWDEKIKLVEQEAKDKKMSEDTLLKNVMDVQKQARSDLRRLLESETSSDPFLEMVIDSAKKKRTNVVTYSSEVEKIAKDYYSKFLKHVVRPKDDLELDGMIMYMEKSMDLESDNYVSLQRTDKRKDLIRLTMKEAVAAGGAWALMFTLGRKLPTPVKVIAGPLAAGATKAGHVYFDAKYTKESIAEMRKRASYLDEEIAKLYDEKVRKYLGEK